METSARLRPSSPGYGEIRGRTKFGTAAPALRFAPCGLQAALPKRSLGQAKRGLGKAGWSGRCRQRGLGPFHDRLECGRLGNSEIGQHLAVDQQPGFGEAVDKSAIAQPERPHRRVQPLNPQRPEGALPPLAVPEGVLVRLLDRLLGDPDGVLPPAVIALGGFEDLLVLGVSGDATFDAGHGRSPRDGVDSSPSAQPLGRKYFLILSPSVLNRTLVPRNWRICFLVRLIMPWRLRECAKS